MVWSIVNTGFAFRGHSELFLLQFSLYTHTQLSIYPLPPLCFVPLEIVSSLRKGMVLNMSLYFSQRLPGLVPSCAQGLVFTEAVGTS